MATVVASDNKPKIKRVSRSVRAGLQFPVGRIHRKLKQGNFAERIKSVGAPIYLAAVLEYLTAEMLEIAGNVCHTEKHLRITPSHLKTAVLGDEELYNLLKGTQFSGAYASTRPQPVSTLDGAPTKKTKKEAISKNKKNLVVKKKKEAVVSVEADGIVLNAPDVEMPAVGIPKRVIAKPARLSFTWQYQDNGWKNYEIEAAQAVEEQYQEYLNNPAMCDVRSVKSGKWKYMVDFLNWRQTNIEHQAHTVRNIRRVDISSAVGA